MKTAPKISPSEWAVMHVLWEGSPMTGRQIADVLRRSYPWRSKTVDTFLARLVSKRVVGTTRRGNANLYAPRLGRDACTGSEVDSVQSRVFRGSAALMIEHLLARSPLTAAELERLQLLMSAKCGPAAGNGPEPVN